MPDSQNEGKQCHGPCNEWKPLDQFYRQTNAPDGLRYICKTCQLEYSRTRHRDREDVRKRTARWVAENPEKAKESARLRAKRYRERHPEKVRESSRKYYERTKKGNNEKN